MFPALLQCCSVYTFGGPICLQGNGCRVSIGNHCGNVEELDRSMKLSSVSLLVCLLAVAHQVVKADDWPQYRGPDRTCVSREQGLLKTWPTDGPTLLWTFHDAGVGFSPPAVVDGRLYTMGARGVTDFLYALDVTNGRELWAVPLGPIRPVGWGDGPCATPTVDGERMYALTTWGDLYCVETATGKKLWNVHLKEDLEGKVIHDGRYTESPLIDGDVLVCTPGGQLGTVATFNKLTGEPLWRSKGLTDEAVSSSSIRVEINGLPQYVNLTSQGVVGVAVADGRLLWQSDIPAAWIMVAAPICSDDCVFVTTAYGRGCGLLRLTRHGDSVVAEEVYRNKVMKNHHGGVLLVDGYVYGHSDPNGWVCLEFATGNEVWKERSQLGKGSLTCVDGHLYCYSEREGTVVLVEASPAGWHEKGRFTIPGQTKLPRNQGQIWTPPVVANGRLYLRDQDLLYCYDVREKTLVAE